MKTKKDVKTVERRDFLKLAGLGSVAGAAAVASGTRKADAATVEGVKSSGYRETAHVKKFYELSRF